jgi:tRNA G46 methylase TrmB
VEFDSYKDKEFPTLKNAKRWTFSLLYYNYARVFFITLSFVSMLAAGFFGIPMAEDFFSKKEVEMAHLFYSIFSFLGCIWGLMAFNQFDKSIKLIRLTWSYCRKLDPMIGEYDWKTFNPETKQWEDGYTHYDIVDFWDSENEVPHWLDKGKYWKILIEMQKISKNVVIQVTKDANLPFNQGKNNLTVTIRYNQSIKFLKKLETISNNKKWRFRIIIPQWLVLNTEYKRFNANSQLQIESLTRIISEVNRNIPRIIDEIIYREWAALKQPWIILTSAIVYLNKSLPIRIIYSEVRERLPGAKKRQIQNANENLSRISTEELIDVILTKAKMVGMEDNTLDKISSLLKFLKNEYDKLGLGEGSSEYHNLHHSLEVTYMSLHMLPKEIHGYTINNKDYEILIVAGLLHDYDPIHSLKFSRVPTVTNTIEVLKRKRIHDAYFAFNNEELIRFFRAYESPLLPIREFITTHPEYLKENESNIESKIVEALIWRTDYPFDQTSQYRFNQLLIEISNSGFSAEKINLISEILSLADLSVTYLSSDPLLAWNRVVKLYQELDFPVVEAVARTDRFLSLFAEGTLFKEIIYRKNFPEKFRQKWSNVYHFFHEGNPSNRINKLISEAKVNYQKVNLEADMDNCDFLINNAINNKNEFFIGIGKDKEEIMRAQSKLAGIGVDNLAILPGNTDKLLPFIGDKSIDNFIITLLSSSSKKDPGKTRLLNDLLYTFSSKLTPNGTIQILVESNQEYNSILPTIPTGFNISKTSEITLSKNVFVDEFVNFENLRKINMITISKS